MIKASWLESEAATDISLVFIMFIGHLPAGYLTTKAILSRTRAGSDDAKTGVILISVGLMASLLTDLDMLYFYLIDHRQHLHHGYWTHLPIFWLIVCLGIFASSALVRSKIGLLVAMIFTVNIFGHLLLDTITGGIRWLAPWSPRPFTLVMVQAQYDWWVLNFMGHWSFAIEILLVFVALLVFGKSIKTQRLANQHDA